MHVRVQPNRSLSSNSLWNSELRESMKKLATARSSHPSPEIVTDYDYTTTASEEDTTVRTPANGQQGGHREQLGARIPRENRGVVGKAVLALNTLASSDGHSDRSNNMTWTVNGCREALFSGWEGAVLKFGI